MDRTSIGAMAVIDDRQLEQLAIEALKLVDRGEWTAESLRLGLRYERELCAAQYRHQPDVIPRCDPRTVDVRVLARVLVDEWRHQDNFIGK